MTDRYAVIGNPISHSKSPLIHTAFARQTGQDMSYTTLLAPVDGLAEAVQTFRAEGGKGLNVTMPFKLQALALADVRLPRADLAGATNALKFEGGRILADNFDGVGLVRDIEANHGVSLAGKRVLMLGAGGAVRGALLPCLERQPAAVVIANRTVDKARALATQFGAHGPVSACGYGDLDGERFDVVLNGTSASLGGDLPPVPASVFDADALAYEMVYGKGMTPFLRLARNAGVRRLADGVGILVEQAAEAFAWWRGVRPDTREVMALLTVPLA